MSDEMEAMLDDAIKLAVDAHRGQVDKGDAPYILHPLRVMLACKTEQERIVAVLHDAVEDGGVELRLIGHRFGQEVAEAVDCLTRRDGESYSDFIDRCAANPLARRVKLADLADNMDLTRLGRLPTDKDGRRHEKYCHAKMALIMAETGLENSRVTD